MSPRALPTETVELVEHEERTVTEVKVACPCPGTPHAEDTVSLHPEATFEIGMAVRQDHRVDGRSVDRQEGLEAHEDEAARIFHQVFHLVEDLLHMVGKGVQVVRDSL